MKVRSGRDGTQEPSRPPKVLDGLRSGTRRATWGRSRWVEARRERFRPSWTRPVRRAPDWVQDTVAVTPVVGTVMILAISVIGIGAVLVWGVPNIQQTQASIEIDGIIEQFMVFDQVSDQAMRGGAIGKASEVKLNMPTGQLHRVDGELLVVSWSLHQGLFANTDRFWVDGLDDGDPQTFTVRSQDGDPNDELGLKVEQAFGSITKPLIYSKNTGHKLDPSSGAFGAGGGSVDVTLGDDIHDRPTRIEVTREIAGGERVVVEDIWIFPMGALVYQRHTNFGNVQVLLENSVVISHFETGMSIRTDPLTTIERNSTGPTFAAIFPMRYADNETFPGIQLGGGGHYPLLFALAGNHLRANGDEALAMTIKPIGDRADLWMDHYKNEYGFISNQPTDASVSLVAGSKNGQTYPFKVVVMESHVEATLKLEVAALDRN